MKNFGLVILLVCFTFGITIGAFSQIYFEDNFDNANKSKDK